MDQLEQTILDVNKKMIENGTLEAIVESKLKAAYEDAIKSAFQWGELRKAIEKKVEAALIPAVEAHDMSAYVVKMDDLLTTIIEQTALPDYKQLMDNFKNLLVTPVPRRIELSEIVKKYADFCARNIDCSGREVCTDDEPSYVSGEVTVRIEDRTSKYSRNNERAALICELTSDDESEENQKKLYREIPLTKYSWEDQDSWGIRYNFMETADLTSLRSMDEFDVWLIALSRSESRILDDIDDSESDDFYPEETPECEWS